MPFPLAHPAAVLPFRRHGGLRLCLPALVIGSIIPDSGYLFGRLKVENLSHELLGIVVYCLPAGLLLTLLLYAGRGKLADVLPTRYRSALLAEKWRERGSMIIILLSVCVGAATHLGWDSFTHPGGWVAQRVPVLQAAIGSVAGHNVRVCRLLWYASSFAGIAYVYLVYRQAQRGPESKTPRAAHLDWLEALAISAGVIPIELAHDLLPRAAAMVAVTVFSALLVLVVVHMQSRSPLGANSAGSEGERGVRPQGCGTGTRDESESLE